MPAIQALTIAAAPPLASAAHTNAELLAENESQHQELDAYRGAFRQSGDTISILNAQLALSQMTYAKACQQLAAQEEKRAAPKRKEISTALGCILTHESFINVQLEMNQHQDDAEEAKGVKEQLEKDWKKYEQEYDEGVELWKAEVERRKQAGERRPLKPKNMAKRVWLAAHVIFTANDDAASALDDANGEINNDEVDA